jgi:PBP1b-binding outer membrane lipoprotein LpoB
MKKVLMIAAVALLAVACNKNQSAVKKLDGTWDVTSLKVTEDGTSIDFIEAGFINSATITFDGCKLKNDEFCAMTTTTESDFGTDTEADVYAVTDDGTTLQTKDDAASTSIETIEIVELSKTDCKLKQVDGDTVTEMTLEKQ